MTTLIKPFSLFLITVFLLLSKAYADIYQWRDRDGKVHFSDIYSVIGAAKKITPNPMSTYSFEHKQVDYLEQRAKEKQGYSVDRGSADRTRQQSTEQEVKRVQKCNEAKQQLNIFNRKSYTDTSLEGLLKRRLKRDKLKSKIKLYCY